MPAPITAVVAGFELTLLLAGIILCWRLALSPTARRLRAPPALAPWKVSLSDFLLFLFLGVAGMIVGSAAANLAGKSLGLAGPGFLVVAGSGGQIGLLAGGVIGLRQFRRDPVPASTVPPGILVSGLATFLISLPVLTLTSVCWRAVLRLIGLPEEHQELVDLFAHAESPVVLGILLLLAIVIAPMAEEFLFRAGLFRFLRTRISRWIALLAPGMLFAMLHMNFASFAPLVVLAVIFSLAYERTGRIGTSIVAHALFNLNTIMLIFSGVGDLA